MNIGEDASVERLDEPEARVRQIEPADDRRIAAVEDADDAAFQSVLVRPAFDAREHTVAVHRLLDVARGDVQIGRLVGGFVRNDEAVSRGMRLKAADNQIHLVGKPDAIALRLHELTARDEGLQQSSEGSAFLLGNLEGSDEVARSGGMRDFFTHQFQYLFSR